RVWVGVRGERRQRLDGERCGERDPADHDRMLDLCRDDDRSTTYHERRHDAAVEACQLARWIAENIERDDVATRPSGDDRTPVSSYIERLHIDRTRDLAEVPRRTGRAARWSIDDEHRAVLRTTGDPLPVGEEPQPLHPRRLDPSSATPRRPVEQLQHR